jgi:hypothetical protein
VPEAGRLAVLGVAQHAAEGDALGERPVDLLERDRPLAAALDPIRHAGRGSAFLILDPGLGQDQSLAGGALAQLAAARPGDTDGMLALPDQGGVVDHQDGLRAADEPIGLPDQPVLERGRGPGRGGQA